MKTEYIIGICFAIVLLFLIIYTTSKKKNVDVYEEKELDEEWDSSLYKAGYDHYDIGRHKKDSVLNPPQKVYLYSVGFGYDTLIDEYDSIRKCAKALNMSRHSVKSLAKSEKLLDGNTSSFETYLTFKLKKLTSN